MTPDPSFLLAEKPSGEFRRELGLLSSTMIVVGSMVGSGIFIVSADIARTVGSAGYLLLVWVITGVLTLIAAFNYGTLARLLPHAGGQYVYLREAYGPLIGFLYGWTLFLIIQTGTIAAVAVAFAKFTAIFLPRMGEQNILFAMGTFKISAAQVVAIGSIVFLTYVNARGLREGKILQNTFTITKIVSLLVIIVLGIMVGKNSAALSVNFTQFWNAFRTTVSSPGTVSIQPLTGIMLFSALGVAMVGSLFSADAWNNITFTAGEVINPKRTIPVSLVLGTGLVTVLYLLCNVAYIFVLPVAGRPDTSDIIGRGIQFAVSDRVCTAAAWVIFGAPAEYIMAGLIMVSTFGCNNGLILSGARVYYAMSRDRLFFQAAGRLNKKSVPGMALAFQAVWAGILCLSGTYSDLLDYVIFAVLIFYSLTIGGILILRKKEPTAEQNSRGVRSLILPCTYIVAAIAICTDLLIFKPTYTWPGVIIVLLGIPVYFFRKNVVKKCFSD
jgi:basic amino acid/polyamine antiporter, APA family